MVFIYWGEFQPKFQCYYYRSTYFEFLTCALKRIQVREMWPFEKLLILGCVNMYKDVLGILFKYIAIHAQLFEIHHLLLTSSHVLHIPTNCTNMHD